ncbi:MAG: 50S ribosomal protein L10 [Pseudomonadota bacterium]
MDRAAKEALVAELHGAFLQSSLLIVTHQTGMTVFESQDLRKRMRDANARFKVAKNRLARLALEGTPYEGLGDQLTGPTGLVWSDDPVEAAKAMIKFTKDSKKLTIVAAGFGSQVLDAKGVEQVSKMPSLDELRGKLVGLMQAPAVKLVGVLPAPATQMVGVLQAGSSKLPRVLNAYAQKEAA